VSVLAPSLSGLIAEFAARTDLNAQVGGPDAFKRGLAQIEAELIRLSTDAYAAAARHVSLAEAVTNFEHFPILARCHIAIDDILHLSLPPDLSHWGAPRGRAAPP
jgi:hypothetical protein